MNVVKSTYAWAGRAAFRWGLPFWRRYLRQSNRAYVLLCNGGETLAIKSWLNNGVWHMPGGGLRKNESAESAVRREVLEELGIDLGGVKLSPITAGVWQTNRLASRYQILAGVLASRPELKFRRPEIMAAAWLKPAEFTPKNTPAEMLEALHKLKL
jgi:8-oxo-dGTP pyrophosphatase MutT (NUDIX family)